MAGLSDLTDIFELINALDESALVELLCSLGTFRRYRVPWLIKEWRLLPDGQQLSGVLAP